MITLIMSMAGKGSRFSDAGYTVPKPFLKVNDGYMFMEAASCLPVEQYVFICLHSHLKYMENALPANSRVVSIPETLDGEAETCAVGLRYMHPRSPILISACDHGIRYDMSEYKTIKADIIVFVVAENSSIKGNRDAYSWAHVESDNVITSVSCKKYLGNNNVMAVVGTFYFDKAEIFERYYTKCRERVNGEYYVESVIDLAVKSGLRVKAFQVDEYMCWGTPTDYVLATCRSS
jgi:dTDP-glucose pyrophosphorylase